MVIENQRKALLAACWGNIIEWYDYGLFAYFIPVFSRIFFPEYLFKKAVFYTFLVFLGAQIVRALSCLLFGWMVDHYGRKPAFLITTGGIILTTIFMCLLPTYAQIGGYAILLLLLIRSIQGLFIAIELPVSMIYSVEHAEKQKRGLWSSTVMASGILGLCLASLVVFSLEKLLSVEQLHEFGWRIAYVIAVVLAFGRIYFRRYFKETSFFLSSQKLECIKEKAVKNIIKGNKKKLFFALLMTLLSANATFVLFIYMPSYVMTIHHYSISFITSLGVGYTLAYAMLLPCMGYLTDRFGALKVFCLGASAFVIYPVIFFWVLGDGSTLDIVVALFVYVIFLAMINGSISVLLTNMFKGPKRATSIMLSFGIGLPIFAGIAPTISSYLDSVLHNQYVPAFYIILSAVLVIVGRYLILKLDH